MQKLTRSLLSLTAASMLLFTTACGDESMTGPDGDSLGGALGGLLGGDEGGEAVGGASDAEGGSDAAAQPSNANADRFAEFLEPGDTYFGPAGELADIDTALSGKDAAGSRYGGPDDQVGVLVFIRDKKGFMKVVNLQNKRRYNVVDTDGNLFSTPTDTLGGRDFVSIYIHDILSLTEFTFDRHFPGGGAPKCNQYIASFKGSVESGEYVADATSTQGSCRVDV